MILIVLGILGACVVVFSFLFDKPQRNKKTLHDPNKPFFFTEKEKRTLSRGELRKLYQPALIAPGVRIPLEAPKPVEFPLSEQEIEALRAGLRYVWCDGFESAEWQQRNCKYLGIRLSESFILHETVLPLSWDYDVACIRKRCKARYLTLDELRLLDVVWDMVSEMRQKAEDCPLPEAKFYWFEPDKNANTFEDWADRQGNVYSHPSEAEACLLLAVINHFVD